MERKIQHESSPLLHCFNARISCFQAEFLDEIPRNPFCSFVRGTCWSSLSSSRQGTEHFKRAQAGSGPRFNAKLYEDFEDVLFHCRFAIAKDRCDLTICFSLGEPQQRFGDARSQAERRFQRSGRVEVRLELRHSLWTARSRRERMAARRSVLATGLVK